MHLLNVYSDCWTWVIPEKLTNYLNHPLYPSHPHKLPRLAAEEYFNHLTPENTLKNLVAWPSKWNTAYLLNYPRRYVRVLTGQCKLNSIMQKLRLCKTAIWWGGQTPLRHLTNRWGLGANRPKLFEIEIENLYVSSKRAVQPLL